MSKIVIIGGGIAGLTAGVFAQRYGYESEIFERHSIIGGECTGWSRNGFHIDNCIHWLTGTNPSTALYQLWEDIGALGSDVEMIQPDRFYTSHIEEKTVTLWRDKDKTREELQKFGRGDGKTMEEFMDAVTALEKLEIPAEMPMDMMSKRQLMKLGLSMFGMMKYMKKYGKMTVREFAKTWKSPVLRQFFGDYMDGNFSALSLLSAYATFTSGNGDIPKGGSVQMAQRIADKYRSLGGVIHTGTPVAQINVDGTKATGITLEDGTVIAADYLIPACDVHITFGKLLDKAYMPKQLAENDKNLKVHSAFQVSFGVDDPCAFLHGTEIFPCRELTVGHSVFHRLGVRGYAYEPSFAPLGKAVLQVHCTQTQEDYAYWRELYDTGRTAYQEKKRELAEEISRRVSAQYQQINGEIEVLDIVTPCTYERFTGAYQGSYMGYIYAPQAVGQQMLTGVIDGLDNVVLATQWQQLPGGLPCAATAGKFAVQRIAK